MQEVIEEIAEHNKKIALWLRNQVKLGVIISLKIEGIKHETIRIRIARRQPFTRVSSEITRIDNKPETGGGIIIEFQTKIQP